MSQQKGLTIRVSPRGTPAHSNPIVRGAANPTSLEHRLSLGREHPHPPHGATRDDLIYVVWHHWERPHPLCGTTGCPHTL
eukprot:1152526-Pelagomonas_calceolata.AAC.5